MENEFVLVLAVFLLGFGLISKRLETTSLTPAMVFAGFGFLVGPAGLGLLELDLGDEALHQLAETTLVLVLFAGAATINLRVLKKGFHLPLRLLGVGLPLTVAAGAMVARWIFPELSIWGAALLATIVAPTDAALGQAVVSSHKVPVRIRQALNVESGLNDGICLPFVMLFLALAPGSPDHSAAYWATYALGQIALGPLAGVAIGWIGSTAIERAVDAGRMNRAFERISSLAMALLAYSLAEAIGGNGFISAFAAGLTVGARMRREIRESVLDFAETEGQLLGLLAFTVFGAANVGPIFEQAGPQALLFAVLALTVLRMLPVAVSLIGAGMSGPTFAFLGWFGPRGLASILYVLIISEIKQLPGRETIFLVVMTTVLLSVVLHGFTAGPGAEWYSRQAMLHKQRRPAAAEHVEVEEMPVRMPFRGVHWVNRSL